MLVLYRTALYRHIWYLCGVIFYVVSHVYQFLYLFSEGHLSPLVLLHPPRFTFMTETSPVKLQPSSACLRPTRRPSICTHMSDTYICSALHTNVKHNLSILQSSTHPLISISCPSFSHTHRHTHRLAAATAVGFQIIPLSSRVITALNSSPRSEGGLAHTVFSQTAASGPEDVTPTVSCLGSRTLWRIKKETSITC